MVVIIIRHREFGTHRSLAQPLISPFTARSLAHFSSLAYLARSLNRSGENRKITARSLARSARSNALLTTAQLNAIEPFILLTEHL